MTYTSPTIKLFATTMVLAAIVVFTAPGGAAQQTGVVGRLTGEGGTPPRIAVPDLLSLSADKETQEAARVIGQVLWDDLNYEREFYLIPRDTYKSIPVAASIDSVPYDRWRELGADGVIIGTVQKAATGVRIEMRLYNVRSRTSAFGKEYTGSAANPRIYAHTMSDELHQSQVNLRGVARTKLAFVSDRNREAVVATIEKRDVKEIYIADYDGANQRRITINRTMNLTPNWSPDGRSIAYTSYRTGIPDIMRHARADVLQLLPRLVARRVQGLHFPLDAIGRDREAHHFRALRKHHRAANRDTGRDADPGQALHCSSPKPPLTN